MGVIKAAAGAVLGTLADQWKEYFSCNALDNDVLMIKGTKTVSSRSSNRYGSDNVISDGSGIVVADGQCAIIVCQGVVTEVMAQSGYYTYKSGEEPSIFAGELNEELLREIFNLMWRRFEFGGVAGRDQRVYYFNLKEITSNKFGTAVPVPFRVVDRNLGLDLDVSLRCNGVYSFKITDPISFYTNVCGNVASQYDVDELSSQLKSEFISALQPALAKLSDMEIRPYSIPSHVDDLCRYMNEQLSAKWSKLRGLSIVSVAINSVTLSDDDAKLIKELQSASIMKDPSMAAAQIAAAQANAMRRAAENPNGAVNGFMGMGMAQATGGMNVGDLFKMANSSQQQISDGWKCRCGTLNKGKFCSSCGEKRPESASGTNGWKCSCGQVNRGNFCTACGKRRPEGSPLYVCDKCGWVPDDPYNPPKFCPECGDRFDDKDIKNS